MRFKNWNIKFTCWLCGSLFDGPFHTGRKAHALVCPRRQIQRYCGACGQPLPLTYPMSRKYHSGGCADRASLVRLKKCQVASASAKRRSRKVGQIKSQAQPEPCRPKSVLQIIYAKYTCWLCGEVFDGPFHEGRKIHALICVPRQVQRFCGICKEPLPLDSKMCRKYHIGDCSDEAQLALMKRRSPNPTLWTPARVERIADALRLTKDLSRVAEENNLTEQTLAKYLKDWRREGVGGLVVLRRKSPIPRPVRPVWRRQLLEYPFLVSVQSEEERLLYKINSLVPHEINFRDDLVQEILLAIYEGKTSVEQLGDNLSTWISRVRRQINPYQEKSVSGYEYDFFERGRGARLARSVA